MIISEEKIKECLKNLIRKNSTLIYDSRKWILQNLRRTLKDKNECPFGPNGCDFVCSLLFIKYRKYWYDNKDRTWRCIQPCGCHVAEVANIDVKELDYILETMIQLIVQKKV